MTYRDTNRSRGGDQRCADGAPSKRVSLAMAFGLIATLALASTAVRAADDDEGPLEGDWSQKLTNRMKDSIGGAVNRIGIGRPAGPPPAEAPSGCPTIAMLPGTEAQRVTAAGQTDNAGVRYQYSLATVGRECTQAGGRVTVKVGAEGRVLLGPAGAAGRFDVPIRVAVFDEMQHKVIESRLFKVPATVPAGQAGASFTFVSDAIAMSVPAGRAKDFTIKVGIDSGGKSGAETAKPRRARRGRPAQAAAN